MGRVGVDIYPVQIGVGLEDVTSFGKYLGGSATNVAVAAARHGRRSAVITRTGADPFGRFVHQALRGFGVDDRFVSEVPGLPTPVTFCEIFPPDDFPLYFYREPKAPDLEIAVDELDLAGHRRRGHLLGHRHRVLAGTVAERDQGGTGVPARLVGLTVLDLDYRPMFWPNPSEAHDQVSAALPHSSTSRSATSTSARSRSANATPSVPPTRCSTRASASRSSSRARRACWARAVTSAVVVPPVPVDVVNGLGAGDAFGGALCHGLLSGWYLEQTLRFANAAGAIVAGRLACADAMPTTADLDALLATVVS